MKFIVFLSILLNTHCFGLTFKNLNSDSNRNIGFYTKGINIGYRAGIDKQNNELLLGYYFDFVDQKRHKLYTLDNDLWTNFNRFGFNSTISCSNDFLSISYSSDVFKNNNKFIYLPSFGVGIGYNDLISFGVFYHIKIDNNIYCPDFNFKLVLRPSFIHVLAQNPDRSKW